MAISPYQHVGYNRSALASHNHNFNFSDQHVNLSSCARSRSDSCFHNRANRVKSNKTVRDLSVHEDVTREFCSNITSEPIKSVLLRKSIHKSVSSRLLSRASVSTSSVESNVSFSVSCTSTCLDQGSPVFNIQEYLDSTSKRVNSKDIFYILLFFLTFSIYYLNSM